MSSWFRRDTKGTILLRVHVQPGARRSEVVGLHGDALKIRLAAPPVEGKANAALIEFLAEKFGVPARQVALTRGEKSREKVVAISGSGMAPDTLLSGARPPG